MLSVTSHCRPSHGRLKHRACYATQKYCRTPHHTDAPPQHPTRPSAAHSVERHGDYAALALQHSLLVQLQQPVDSGRQRVAVSNYSERVYIQAYRFPAAYVSPRSRAAEMLTLVRLLSPCFATLITVSLALRGGIAVTAAGRIRGYIDADSCHSPLLVTAVVARIHHLHRIMYQCNVLHLHACMLALVEPAPGSPQLYRRAWSACPCLRASLLVLARSSP